MVAERENEREWVKTKEKGREERERNGGERSGNEGVDEKMG